MYTSLGEFDSGRKDGTFHGLGPNTRDIKSSFGSVKCRILEGNTTMGKQWGGCSKATWIPRSSYSLIVYR